jgi:hypothetical protein
MSEKIVTTNELTTSSTQQYAPLILFVYSRLEHTKRTIEAIRRNKEAINTELFVFCDAPNPKSTTKELCEIYATQDYLKTLKEGFAKINLEISQEHRGAGKAIIRGISRVLTERKMCIILENDMEVSPLFLEYMNKCLVAYERDKKIYGIASTSYNFNIPVWYKNDLYLLTRTESWGWATWSDRWENVDWSVKDFITLSKSKNLQNSFNKGGNDLYSMLKDQVDGKTDTWDLQWAWHVFKQHGYFVYSRYCFQENKGFDGSGRHCGNNDNIKKYFAPLYTKSNLQIDCKALEPNCFIMNRFRRYHNKYISFIKEKTLISTIVKKLKKVKYLFH